jgi:hypothetical protein
MLIRIGSFRELRHGREDGPSLLESRVDYGERKADVVRYLAAASVLAASGTAAVDEIGEERTLIGGLHMQTDGRWLWASDLAYYVEVYDAALPDEFLAWGESRDWNPPDLTDEDLIGLCDEEIVESGSA